MGLQVSTTSPGWPRPDLPDPVFNAILAPIVHTGSSNVTPDEAEIGKPSDLGIPGASTGYENSGDVIDTATFTAEQADSTECEEPPYEPVYPPSDDEPPEYGDPPSGWNPPVTITDPEQPLPETIEISVTGDDADLCINEAGATITSTQTVIPAQYADLFDPPTNGYNGNVGTYPVIPGQFHNPNDGNNYVVTSQNGTLTVEYCDPDYDVICDCSLVADSTTDSEGRFYKTEATYPRYDCSHMDPSNYNPTDAFYMTPIHSYIAVAIKLAYRGENPEQDPSRQKSFKISYRDLDNILREVSLVANSYNVVTEYCIYAEYDYNQVYKAAIVNAYMRDQEWSFSVPFTIVVEEVDEDGVTNYRFKKTFNINHLYHTCPLHTTGEYERCPHHWVTTTDPTTLWAGTAQPG